MACLNGLSPECSVANASGVYPFPPLDDQQDSPAFSIFMSFEHEGIHIETSSVLFRELPAELVKKPIWVRGSPGTQ